MKTEEVQPGPALHHAQHTHVKPGRAKVKLARVEGAAGSEHGGSSASAGRVRWATDHLPRRDAERPGAEARRRTGSIFVGGLRASPGRVPLEKQEENSSASTCDTFIKSLTNTPLCPPLLCLPPPASACAAAPSSLSS